jgi:signal transduction histidine kinase
VEAAAYFVCSEGLANVAKYARAASAAVHVTASDGALVVVVADDGVGGADVSSGSGLRGLADRVAALGGRFEVTSLRGSGTRLRAELPLEQRS